MTTALAITPTWPREKVDLIKRTICKGATDDELSMFVQTSQRLGLDPFARQVFAVKRWDNSERREVMSIQVSIDGFRLVAERTGKYAGQLGPLWTGDGKEWIEVWLSSTPPAAAKVGVMRHDFKEPVWSVATWDQYKQTKRDGGLTSMWAKMGPLMLAKCAESLALRRAFPNELSGVYTTEEMSQATTDPVPTATVEAAADISPSQVGTAAIPASGSSSGSKKPRANTIKHDGTFASHKQVAYLHMLKVKVGGLVFCRDDKACYIDVGDGLQQVVAQLCAYHKQLAAFKDCDGKPIKTSKDLSETQASNLIDRYEEKIKQQEARAAEAPDLEAAFSQAEENARIRGELGPGADG